MERWGLMTDYNNTLVTICKKKILKRKEEEEKNCSNKTSKQKLFK